MLCLQQVIAQKGQNMNFQSDTMRIEGEATFGK